MPLPAHPLHASASPPPPAVRAPRAEAARLWLCVHLPDLALEAAGAPLRPDSPENPPAAVWDTVAGRPLILTAAPAAAALGVVPGLPLNAALALCGGLRLLRRDPAAERQLLHALATLALAYTPWVSLDHPAALLLEVRGSLVLFDGIDRLLERLRPVFGSAGRRVVLAVAPAPLPAWLLARAGREEVVDAPEAIRSRLGDLPLNLLPVAPATRERLGQSGLGTLRDLWRLPREGLARRHGPALLRQLDRAAGLGAESPRPFAAPARFRAQRTLPAETASLTLLTAILGLLLKELAEFLRERAAITDRLELEIRHFRRPPTRLELRLRCGSRDPGRFAALLAERLERTPLPAPATGLCLRCENLAAERPDNGDLFAAHGAPGGLDWAALLEHLEQRLGREAVKFLHPAADHRPERAERLTGPPAPGRPGRPLWLLPEPRPCDPRRYRLLPGLERIEAGWWDGADIRRDYRVGVSPEGARAWLYRNLESGTWYVQGMFG